MSEDNFDITIKQQGNHKIVYHLITVIIIPMNTTTTPNLRNGAAPMLRRDELDIGNLLATSRRGNADLRQLAIEDVAATLSVSVCCVCDHVGDLTRESDGGCGDARVVLGASNI